MRLPYGLALVVCVLVSACQAPADSGVIVLDGDRETATVESSPRIEAMLAEAGVLLAPADAVFLRGVRVEPSAIPDEVQTGPIQIKHAVRVTVNGQPRLTTCDTVAEVLAEAGHSLYAADLLDPPGETPVSGGMAITYAPARQVSVHVSGTEIQIRTSAGTVGEALAEAGLPALGLDMTDPPSAQALPDSGSIRLTRVNESVILTQESIPFKSEYQDDPQLGLGEEQILQSGVAGLSVVRTRVRYEDGREVSRNSESMAVVRPPQARLVARGTKVVEKTVDVNGISLTYWHEMQMYATVYSPCESATGDSGGCSYGTASGLRAGKGVVAVDPALFAYLNGQRLYIPGYGYAVIGDIGGGYIVERNIGVSRYKWIDLGFDDGNIAGLSGWITVYFLAPAPPSVPDVLK